MINDRWEVVQGGQDLKTFIEGFAERIKNYKGPLITGQSVINPELHSSYEKENLIKNHK